jgi:hypothetical protein
MTKGRSVHFVFAGNLSNNRFLLEARHSKCSVNLITFEEIW